MIEENNFEIINEYTTQFNKDDIETIRTNIQKPTFLKQNTYLQNLGKAAATVGDINKLGDEILGGSNSVSSDSIQIPKNVINIAVLIRIFEIMKNTGNLLPSELVPHAPFKAVHGYAEYDEVLILRNSGAIELTFEDNTLKKLIAMRVNFKKYKSVGKGTISILAKELIRQSGISNDFFLDKTKTPEQMQNERSIEIYFK